MFNGLIRNAQSYYFKATAGLIAWDNLKQRKRFRKRYAFFYGRNGIGNYPLLENPSQESNNHGPVDMKRARFIQRTFNRSIITLTREVPGPKTLFAFNPIHNASAEAAGGDSYLSLLHLPSQYLQTAEGRALVEKVGELTAKTMVLAITQPRLLYSSTPSDLLSFIDELESRWKEVRVRLKGIPAGLMKLSDSNGERLLMTFFLRDKAPSLLELLPSLRGVITCDRSVNGQEFDKLKANLPGVSFFPMYSVRTETIETLPHRVNGKLFFLPVIQGTFPEFYSQETNKMYSPFDLQKGQIYELIVSDVWGLRRHSTGDLFMVNDIIDGLPGLTFVGKKINF